MEEKKLTEERKTAVLKKFHSAHRPHLTVWLGLFLIAAASAVVAFSPKFSAGAGETTKTEDSAPSSTADDLGPITDADFEIETKIAQSSKLSAAHESAKLNPGEDSSSTAAKARESAPKKYSEAAITLSVSGNKLETRLKEGGTVYDLMVKLQNEKQLQFNAREFSGLGYFIEEINGLKNDGQAKKYWIYYINGEKAKVGVSAYVLRPGDDISWRYEDEN